MPAWNLLCAGHDTRRSCCTPCGFPHASRPLVRPPYHPSFPHLQFIHFSGGFSFHLLYATAINRLFRFWVGVTGKFSQTLFGHGLKSQPFAMAHDGYSEFSGLFLVFGLRHDQSNTDSCNDCRIFWLQKIHLSLRVSNRLSEWMIFTSSRIRRRSGPCFHH